jgi:hypothetical protein
MFIWEYDKYIAINITDSDITNHAIKGYSRLLDPHAVSLLFISLLSTGHPNILPSTILSDAFDARIVDGITPDNLLTTKMNVADGD